MKRRDLNTLLALSPLAGLAQAQDGPVEGKHYLRLGQQQPTPADKIEVIEFFRFTCPHCYSLDPAVEAWKTRLPQDVSFRQVPIGAGLIDKLLARTHFALEAMGQASAVHATLFNAIHRDHVELEDEKAISAFIGRLGLDTAKFKQAFDSFSMQSKLQQGNAQFKAYGLEFVPTLVVAGRYTTSLSMAGSPGQTVAVTDFLINRIRNKA
jgi:thiol:disulfide interchange protein DsbA